MQLWTDKHKPVKVGDIVGQKKAIEETRQFMDNWKPGKALMFCGPPGVGKTLVAESAARERGWTLVQINASDSRSGKDIEGLLGQSSRQTTLFGGGKLILIDEVDGISGQERGGAAAIAKVIKDSRFPIILVANDPWDPKLKALRGCSTMVKFNGIPYPSIAKRLGDIAGKESVKADDEILKSLARWASGDLRSAILDLQLLSAGRDSVAEKDLESLGFREREKSVFDILPTIFFSGSLNAARKAIRETDRDPDEIFWWIEGNLFRVYRDRESLASGYELLSKVDMFRSLVMKQQNWRFKAYMIDLMSGISAFRDQHQGFVPFRPPDRLMMLGQTREKRALLDSLAEKLGRAMHCSKRVVKRDCLPYIRFMLKKHAGILEGFGVTQEELDFLGK